jgi:hypothetical protein
MSVQNPTVLGRIRKSILAGVGAGIAAAGTLIVKALTEGGLSKIDSPLLGAAVGAFVAAAVPVGWAVWRAPNDPKPQIYAAAEREGLIQRDRRNY